MLTGGCSSSAGALTVLSDALTALEPQRTPGLCGVWRWAALQAWIGYRRGPPVGPSDKALDLTGFEGAAEEIHT